MRLLDGWRAGRGGVVGDIKTRAAAIDAKYLSCISTVFN